jgi:hypothetical protein
VFQRPRLDGVNLFSRLLGCLHHCLATGQRYNELAAFPAGPASLQDAA